MSETVIYKNDSIIVEYFPDKGMIHHVIHRPITDQIFMEALDAGTEALKKYEATKWLSDDRKMGPLSDEIIGWSRNVWQPRTIAAGWKYWAVIVPEEIIAAGTLTPVINALHEQGLRMMVFSNADKATAWLDGFN